MEGKRKILNRNSLNLLRVFIDLDHEHRQLVQNYNSFSLRLKIW